MDPSIILQGRQPDLVNVLARSTEAAGRQNDLMRENALNRLYQDQGPGILAGETNALNALAGLDPTAALRVQATRQDMQAGQQRMDILSAQERRAAEEYARGLTAAQRAAEAQQIEDAVKMGMAISDPATWDATMAQMAPELVGQFAQRDALARRFMSWAEIMKGMEAPDPIKGAPSGYAWNDPRNPAAGMSPIPGGPAAGGSGFRVASPEEASAYGAAGGQFGPDGRFYPINPPSGGIEMTHPDGTTVRIGGAGGGKAPSERQSVIALFGSMMDSTMPTINALEAKFNPADPAYRAAAAMGTFGNFLKTDEMQAYEASARAWAEAVLRIQTGAAATAPEVDRVFQTYFAQAGDSPATVAHKRQLRDEYARAVVAASGGTIPMPGGATGTAAGSGLPPPGVSRPPGPTAPATPPAEGLPGLSPEARSVLEKYRTVPAGP